MNRSLPTWILVAVSLCAIAGCGQAEQSVLNSAGAAEDRPLPATASSAAAADDLSASSHSIAVGEVVLANWASDRYWYPATVEKQDAGRFVVRYFDNTVETLTEDRVVADDVTVGDRVYVDWRRRGRYYAATVTARDGELLTVTYDDGTKESSMLEALRLERGDRSGRTAWVASDSSSNGWSSLPYRRPRQRRPILPTEPFGGDVWSAEADSLGAAAEAEAREAAARAVRSYRSRRGGW